MTDYTVGDTCYFMFTTRRFSTGATFTLAGSPVISAYENESLTQITAGITLGVDHDGVTGLNLITVVASGGNGFEAGKDYHLVITTGTVDSISVVGEVVGRFTISREAVIAFVDTEVAAIKAKTDLIPGTQDGKTFAETVILMAAALLGKASGLDTTTATFRNMSDTKARVTATVDASGNRTAVTLDAT